MGKMLQLSFMLTLVFSFFRLMLVQGADFSPVEEKNVSVNVVGQPVVSIIEPRNITYSVNESLALRVDHNADSLWYNLDNGANITLNGTATLSTSEGNHVLYVFGNNSYGETIESVVFGVNLSFIVSQPPSAPGSGGGGSGGAQQKKEAKFDISEAQIKISLKQGATKRIFLEITNADEKNLPFLITSTLPEELIRLPEQKFFLAPDEKKTLVIDFIAPLGISPNLYLGEIIVSSDDTRKNVLLLVEIESENTLFDIKLEIPKEYREVFSGEEILALVTIFSLSRGEKVDTNLQYQIRDPDGNIVLEEREVVAVDIQTILVKEFSIPRDAKQGKQVLYATVTYNGNVGSASQMFRIISEKKTFGYLPLSFIMLFISIMLFILVVALVMKDRKKKMRRKLRRRGT